MNKLYALCWMPLLCKTCFVGYKKLPADFDVKLKIIVMPDVDKLDRDLMPRHNLRFCLAKPMSCPGLLEIRVVSKAFKTCTPQTLVLCRLVEELEGGVRCQWIQMAWGHLKHLLQPQEQLQPWVLKTLFRSLPWSPESIASKPQIQNVWNWNTNFFEDFSLDTLRPNMLQQSLIYWSPIKPEY